MHVTRATSALKTAVQRAFMTQQLQTHAAERGAMQDRAELPLPMQDGAAAADYFGPGQVGFKGHATS